MYLVVYIFFGTQCSYSKWSFTICHSSYFDLRRRVIRHFFFHCFKRQSVACILFLPLGVRLLVLISVLNDDVDFIRVRLILRGATVLPLRLSSNTTQHQPVEWDQVQYLHKRPPSMQHVALRHIRSFLAEDMVESMATAMVLSASTVLIHSYLAFWRLTWQNSNAHKILLPVLFYTHSIHIAVALSFALAACSLLHHLQNSHFNL